MQGGICGGGLLTRKIDFLCRCAWTALSNLTQSGQRGRQDDGKAVDLVRDTITRGGDKASDGFVHRVDLFVDSTTRALHLVLDLAHLVGEMVPAVHDILVDIAVGVVDLAANGRTDVPVGRVQFVQHGSTTAVDAAANLEEAIPRLLIAVGQALGQAINCLAYLLLGLVHNVQDGAADVIDTGEDLVMRLIKIESQALHVEMSW